MAGWALYQTRQTMTLLYCSPADRLDRWGGTTSEPYPLDLVQGDAVAGTVVETGGLG